MQTGQAVPLLVIGFPTRNCSISGSSTWSASEEEELDEEPEPPEEEEESEELDDESEELEDQGGLYCKWIKINTFLSLSCYNGLTGILIGYYIYRTYEGWIQNKSFLH